MYFDYIINNCYQCDIGKQLKKTQKQTKTNPNFDRFHESVIANQCTISYDIEFQIMIK